MPQPCKLENKKAREKRWCSGLYSLSCPVQSFCHSTLKVNSDFSCCVWIALMESLCALQACTVKPRHSDTARGSVVPQACVLPRSAEAECSLMPTQAPVRHPHPAWLVMHLLWHPRASTSPAFSNQWGMSCNWEKMASADETHTWSSPLETGRKPR